MLKLQKINQFINNTLHILELIHIFINYKSKKYR